MEIPAIHAPVKIAPHESISIESRTLRRADTLVSIKALILQITSALNFHAILQPATKRRRFATGCPSRVCYVLPVPAPLRHESHARRAPGSRLQRARDLRCRALRARHVTLREEQLLRAQHVLVLLTLRRHHRVIDVPKAMVTFVISF
jgi:hypothetical protein